MNRIGILSLLAIFLCICSNVRGQTPCPRNQPVMIYHPELEAYLLFGGYCSESNKRLKDLWSYSNGEWTELETILAPYARSGHAMTYDKKGNRLIVFGGKDDEGTILHDTWSWDGEEWSLLTRAGPEARQSHRLVHTSQGILLFGGSGKDGLSLADTWLLKGNRWEEIGVTRGPSARRQHTLAFDENRGRTILFGGFDRKEGEKIIYGDTWEFNGINWELVATNPELARDHHAMTYYPPKGSVMLFGGYNAGYLGDTWSWNGTTWSELDDDGPTRAGKPGMIYDSRSETMVLFGGGNDTNMYLMDFLKFDTSSNTWIAR